MAERTSPQPGRRIVALIVCTHALWLTVIGIVAGLGGWFLLERLRIAGAALEREGIDVPSVASRLYAQPLWIVGLGAAISGCGLLALGRRRHWLWLGLGVLLLAATMASIVVCFVGTLSGMYATPDP